MNKIRDTQITQHDTILNRGDGNKAHVGIQIGIHRHFKSFH